MLFFRNNIQFKLLKNICIQISPRKSSKTLRVAQTLFLRNAPVKYVGNQNSMKCTLTSADHFRETAALEKHHGQQTNTRCWILIKGFQQAPSQILNFKPAKQKYSWVLVRWSFFEFGNHSRLEFIWRNNVGTLLLKIRYELWSEVWKGGFRLM